MKLVGVFVTALLLAVTVGCGGSSQTSSSSSSSGTGTSPLPTTAAPAFSGINLDYAPEGRCSDGNWGTSTPVACNPQLSFTTCTPGVLSSCEQNCQACFNSDLATISSLSPGGTITIYQPNYYLLTAAQTSGIKVVLGLYDDSVIGLAGCTVGTNCTYGGSPFPYSGTSYANAMFNGACGNVTPWPAANFCESTSNNQNPTYVAALGSFLQNGTVVGIQVGNEILGTDSAATISVAAQNLRTALNADYPGNNIKVIVSLIEGQAASFCTNGAPPAGVDYIADHVYCSVGSTGGVASTPPVWPTGSNPAQTCWTQVMSVFATDQNSCGAANVFLGETGYNTGCPPPNNPNPSQVPNEQSFITQMVTSTCQSQVSGPLAPFLFEFGDVCPAGGCLAGCANEPQEGNGYFGIYYTQGYMTEGSLVSKFATPPTLTCP